MTEMNQVKTPQEIIDEAEAQYPIVARYVGFSGGTDSLAITHWMMENVPGTVVFHANTGIGIEKTREFVRDTCRDYGWPLVEIRAKEDCGQDYDQLVKEWGFPGPAHHTKMYNRLKERCVKELARRTKSHRMDKFIIATGIRHDESAVRAGYAGREINRTGSQVWVNPIYWWSGSYKHQYIKENKLPPNPVTDTLGMSGECLCGAYAHKGEKELIRIVDPETAERLDRLEEEVRACGHDWGWEDRPPRKKDRQAPTQAEINNQIMCADCNKQGRQHDR